jgi:competence protein ComEA
MGSQVAVTPTAGLRFPDHMERKTMTQRTSIFRRALLAGLLATASLFVQAGEPVNINTANAETLAASLDGVGLSKARAIVAYRDSQGPFRHADELVNVKGIGLSTVDRNRDVIRIEAPRQAKKSP